jgi:hypothetical protein
MKLLFFDVETTGIANFNAPPEADFQPRIVQLGALLCDDSRRDIAAINLIIRPSAPIPKLRASMASRRADFLRAAGLLVAAGGLLLDPQATSGDSKAIDFSL